MTTNNALGDIWMWTGEDDGKTTEQRAQESFERSSRLNKAVDREVGGKGWLAEKNSNISLGQNILREEIGYFGPWQGIRYGLEQETRDRLLAHCRQDAASAFAMAQSAFREAFTARRLLERAIWLLVVSMGLNAVVLLAVLSR